MEATMSSFEHAPDPIAGSRAKARFIAALGAAAAIASCFADAAALFVERPAQAMTPREALAATARPEADAEGVSKGTRRAERNTQLADAGERRKLAGDEALEPCPAPTPPQFEAMPQGTRELGDFPHLPFA
jgi:hypothetical protein